MKKQGARSREQDPRIRRAMLAKVHIAKKELGLREDEYAAILERYKVTTAADLKFKDLDELIEFFRFLGWQTKPTAQITALRQRVLDEVATIKNGKNRLPGLIKKICGAEKLEWCHSVSRLIALIAVIRTISEGEKNEAARLIQ